MSNNEEFGLSIPAQNIEARFYNKIGIVYVEGDDDVLFWAQYFDNDLFEIRKVDGCNILEKYEKDILHHGLKCIVAKDADYSSYNSNAIIHPLIVCTLSHSIECVMYCPYNVNACLKKLARTLDDHLEQIEQSYSAFFSDAKEVILFDIANNIFGIGHPVCGDSCIPLMESNHSIKVSIDKRNDFLKKISGYFSKEQIDIVRKLLDKDNRNMRQIAKGHFQTAFVLNLLKKLSSQITQDKAPSLSNDALYALLITCYAGCSQNCEERKVITQRVNDAVAELRAL